MCDVAAFCLFVCVSACRDLLSFFRCEVDVRKTCVVLSCLSSQAAGPVDAHGLLEISPCVPISRPSGSFGDPPFFPRVPLDFSLAFFEGTRCEIRRPHVCAANDDNLLGYIKVFFVPAVNYSKRRGMVLRRAPARPSLDPDTP